MSQQGPSSPAPPQRPARSRTTARRDSNGANLYSGFASEDRDDDRQFRRSLWIAAVVHVVILAINFPAFSAPAAEEEPQKKRVFVLENHRYQPPPPEMAPPPPQLKSRKVPIPDPTPNDPEPIPIEDTREVTVDLPPVDIFVIPDRPPEPERNEPYSLADGVVKPVKIFSPPPAYTEIARRARIEGTVILQSVIDEEGRVTDVRVLRGLPMGLSEEAKKAVETWRFEPGTLRGRPVPVYYNLTVTFSLQ